MKMKKKQADTVSWLALGAIMVIIAFTSSGCWVTFQ